MACCLILFAEPNVGLLLVRSSGIHSRAMFIRKLTISIPKMCVWNLHFPNHIYITPWVILSLIKLQVLGRLDLYVGSFYRHTNSDPASIRALSENLLAIMGKEPPKNFVLAGDFNLRSVNWETNDISPSPQYGREVNQMALDMCNDLFWPKW